jgi:hypothetical protein
LRKSIRRQAESLCQQADEFVAKILHLQEVALRSGLESRKKVLIRPLMLRRRV